MATLCGNIKLHGYAIAGLSALLTSTVLISSAYLQLLYRGSDELNIPKDLQDLVDYSPIDFAGDIIHLACIGVLFYGIRKENRFCLMPFMVSIVVDWIVYVVTNAHRGSSIPYQVWLLTTALFLYIFVTLIGLYQSFAVKAKEGPTPEGATKSSRTFCA